MAELPKLLATLLAFVALGASILSGVEPIQCVIRGGVAFVVGMFSGQAWNLFFLPSPNVAVGGAPSAEAPSTELPESTDAAPSS